MSDRAWEISGMIFSADSDLTDQVMEALGDALFNITQDATIGGHLVTLDENGETAADRRWDALTSPETIEKGAKAWVEFEGDMWGQFSPPQKERIRDVIEAVLRAVGDDNA